MSLKPTILKSVAISLMHTAAAEAATAEPEILVTADRIAVAAFAAHEARRAAPSATTIIDSEQLSQFGELALGDALRRMPGVTFDGGNRARELRLRGIGDEYAQVLLNGFPFIDGNSRRSAQLDRIPASLIDRAEILRAPLARYEGQGAAGTLNLRLPSRDFTPRTRLGVSVGDIDTQGLVGEVSAVLATRFDVVGAALNASLQRNRRAESRDSLIFQGDGSPNGGDLQTNLRRYRQGAVMPSVGVDIGPGTRGLVEGLWLWTEEKRLDDRTELLANQTSIRRREVEDRLRIRENSLVRASVEQAIATNGLLTFSLDWQTSREDTARDSRRFTATGVQDRTRKRNEAIRIERLSPSVVLFMPVDGHDIRLGGDLGSLTRRERNSEIENGASRPPNLARVYDIEERRANIFAEDVWSVSRSVRLAVGGRLEWSRTETVDGTGARGTRDVTFLLPNANLAVALAENLDMRAGVARTLRRPNLRELSPFISRNAGTISNPDTGGNPEAAPERIWGFDGGLDLFLAGQRGLLAVSGFWRQFDDKIEFLAQEEAGRFVSRPQNVGTGELWGMEAEMRLPMEALGAPWLTLWGNATLIRTRVDAADSVHGARRRFLGQPDAVLNGGVDLFVEAIRTAFGIGANWNSGYEQRRRLANGDVRSDAVEPIARLDLSARTQLAPALSLSLAASNLTARTERSSIKISAPDGSVRSITRVAEPTYRSLFLRLGVGL